MNEQSHYKQTCTFSGFEGQKFCWNLLETTAFRSYGVKHERKSRRSVGSSTARRRSQFLHMQGVDRCAVCTEGLYTLLLFIVFSVVSMSQ